MDKGSINECCRVAPSKSISIHLRQHILTAQTSSVSGGLSSLAYSLVGLSSVSIHLLCFPENRGDNQQGYQQNWSKFISHTSAPDKDGVNR